MTRKDVLKMLDRGEIVPSEAAGFLSELLKRTNPAESTYWRVEIREGGMLQGRTVRTCQEIHDAPHATWLGALKCREYLTEVEGWKDACVHPVKPLAAKRNK